MSVTFLVGSIGVWFGVWCGLSYWTGKTLEARRTSKTHRALEATIRQLEKQLSTLADHAAMLEGRQLPGRAESSPPSGSDPSPY
jgi:membrane protein DedA with SNARE-associated domain